MSGDAGGPSAQQTLHGGSTTRDFRRGESNRLPTTIASFSTRRAPAGMRLATTLAHGLGNTSPRCKRPRTSSSLESFVASALAIAPACAEGATRPHRRGAWSSHTIRLGANGVMLWARASAPPGSAPPPQSGAGGDETPKRRWPAAFLRTRVRATEVVRRGCRAQGERGCGKLANSRSRRRRGRDLMAVAPLARSTRPHHR